MSNSDCSHWADLTDRAAEGEALDDNERRFVHRHPTQCVACAAEAEVWKQLSGMLSQEGPGPAIQGPALSSRQPKAARRLALPLVVAGAAAAVAAGVALLMPETLWIVGLGEDRNRNAEQMAAPAEASATVASISGTATIDGAPIVAGMVIRAQQLIKVEQGHLCLAYSRGVTACAAPGSVLRPVTGQQAPRLVLERGAIVCRLDARPTGGEFKVITPRGQVTAKGTVFAVELGDQAELAVRLHRGVVEVESPNGERRELQAPAALIVESELRSVPTAGPKWQTDLRLLEGKELLAQSEPSSRTTHGAESEAPELRQELPSQPGIQPSSTVEEQNKPRAARPSAEELLTQAGKLRAAGHFAEASAAYETLVRQHRSSAAGRAALMSLAELQLSGLGQPAAALRSFDAYLAQGGPLAQEARYGRIRALRRLGRNQEARAATRLFLRDYPGSPQAEAIRDTSAEH